jgi:hypothetical protein
VKLSSNAASNIFAYRLGDDGVAGTDDDEQFDTLAELDAVPFVGPAAFDKLLSYARANGYVASAPDLASPPDLSQAPGPLDLSRATDLSYLLPGIGLTSTVDVAFLGSKMWCRPKCIWYPNSVMSITVTIAGIAGAPGTIAYSWDYDYGITPDHYPPTLIDASGHFDRTDAIHSPILGPLGTGTIHLQGHLEPYRTLVIDNLRYELDYTDGWIDEIQSEDHGIQRY